MLLPTYTYVCKQHGPFEIQQHMKDAGGDRPCPDCEAMSPRSFTIDRLAAYEIWHCQGAHDTDYDKRGDKVEQLNRAWSKATGEEPPAPARDVPKNSSEPF